MLGLRQEIGGNPVGIGGAVGQHQHFGRAGDHVDADLAEHDALGRSHIGVARADDLGHRLDGFGAVGQRRDSLCASDPVDFAHPGKLRRGQHQRIELAIRRGHHHHHARDTRNARRHRIHQHGRRIGGRAARHVKAGRLDRGPARAEFDTKRVGEAIVLRQLAAVKALDPFAGQLQRRDGFAVAGGDRGIDLGLAHPQTAAVQRQAVEFRRCLDQRRIAPRRHVADDGAHGDIDIGGDLALRRQKNVKTLAEIGAAVIETDRHGYLPAD